MPRTDPKMDAKAATAKEPAKEMMRMKSMNVSDETHRNLIARSAQARIGSAVRGPSLRTAWTAEAAIPDEPDFLLDRAQARELRRAAGGLETGEFGVRVN